MNKHSPHLVLLLAQSIKAELKTTMPENLVCLCLYRACPVSQTARGAPFLATVQTYGHKYKRQMWEQPDKKIKHLLGLFCTHQCPL